MLFRSDVWNNTNDVLIDVQLPDGVLYVRSPRERLFGAALFMQGARTRDTALDYMLAHFDEFSKLTGGGGIFSGRAAQMFGSLCTLAAADAVDAKLRPQGGSTLSLDRSLEGIRNCARFKDAKAGEVSAAFAQM